MLIVNFPEDQFIDAYDQFMIGFFLKLHCIKCNKDNISDINVNKDKPRSFCIFIIV